MEIYPNTHSTDRILSFQRPKPNSLDFWLHACPLMQSRLNSPLFLGLMSLTLKKGGSPVKRNTAMPSCFSSKNCLWPGGKDKATATKRDSPCHGGPCLPTIRYLITLIMNMFLFKFCHVMQCLPCALSWAPLPSGKASGSIHFKYLSKSLLNWAKAQATGHTPNTQNRHMAGRLL